MFAPAGWISLKDVYRYFNLYFSEHERFGAYTFTGDEAYELTWQFAEEAETVAVCHPSGAIIYASREILDCSNECSHENYHVNVHYGTVGSGEVMSETKFPDSIREADTYLNLLYGPFRGLPIIFGRDDFEGFLQRMYPDFSEGNIDADDDRAFVLRTSQESDQAGDPPTAQDMSPRAVSKRILSAWRSNRTVVQAEIKALVAPAQSHRQFLLAWGLAAQEEPTIRNPGRRKRES